MSISRWTLRALVVAAVCTTSGALHAQGVTTGAISGTVTNEQNQPLEAAQIQVINRATGARSGTTTRPDGRYYVPSLQVGGPYTVSVRRIGFAPKDTNDIYISLGQNLRVDINIRAQAAQIAAVNVVATTTSAVIQSAHKGVNTLITDSSIARLPTLNRNFTDFLKLTPQITTKGPGNSGGGMNNRFNAIQIDGAVGQDLFGLGSTGQPGGQADAKQVPLGAVKEYQVLLAPFDVRQGNFTGALINAVTKSGTNEWHGEVFGQYRNERMQRDVDYLRAQSFQQDQRGMSVGGPIMRDKILAFVSVEQQHKGTPASGPYFGQPNSAATAVPLFLNDTTYANGNKYIGLDSLDRVMQHQYHYPAVNGSSLGTTVGSISDKNPLQNVFARLDFMNLPMNSRLVARYNYANGKIDQFPVSSSACNRSSTAYCGTNSGYTFNSSTNNELAQLFTNFSNGGSNELTVGYTTIRDIRDVPYMVPFVQVQKMANPGPRDPTTGQPTACITSPTTCSATPNTTVSIGTDNSSQGNSLDQNITELSDSYTHNLGTHRITVGTKNTFYSVRNLFSQNSLGFYTFGTLDSLILGKPNRVQIGKKLDAADGSARFNARTYGFYAQDEWQAAENLSFVVGLRLDIPGLQTNPGRNPLIDSLLHINTANVPKNVLQWGPRVGFNWDIMGDQSSQLRGGSGIFVGQPAWVWISNVFGNSGVNGYATFTCSTAASAPAFTGVNADGTITVPTACASGSTNVPVTVNTLDPDLRFPAAWRSSLGYDHRLPWDVVGTIEGMYTKMVDQFYYQNIGLNSPVGTDAHGRVMYGKLTGTGTGQFNTLTAQYKPGLSDVINLGNETTNKDYSYSITTRLQKRFSNAFEGSVAYSYSRSYNQYDLTSSVAYSNWQFGRAYGGPTEAQQLAPSKWDAPHRVLASGTFSLPTRTDISFIFTGESGVPYTYITSGDLNGDNSANNDPLYIPNNSRDLAEIQFAANGALTPAMQADSLEALINRNECLSSQRGHIMARNSCRFPWTRFVDVSARQSLKTLGMQRAILEVDIFNFLNLINKNWGAYPSGSTNDPFVLIRGAASGNSWYNGNDVTAGAQPFFRFSPNFNLTTTRNASSNYRLQAQVKYTF